MKTTNNVQKTEIRKFGIGVLALALIITSVSSNGQSREFPKSYNKESQIAFVTTHYKSEKSEVINLQVKNGKYVMESNEGTAFVSLQPEPESSLQIEVWMLGNQYFTSGRPEFRNDAEKPLQIERWMTDGQVWNR